MKPRTFVPRKLDMAAFIESGEALAGALAVTELERLAAGLAKDIDLAGLPSIIWSAQGSTEPQRTGPPHLWLKLTARAELAWECQRCLHAVTDMVEFEQAIRFVSDEASAAEMDADSDDDVLALDRQFDLIELIEDELIMAQPIVPRHAQCPTDVAALMNDDTAVDETGAAEPPADPQTTTASGRPNPFAVLAALKKRPG